MKEQIKQNQKLKLEKFKVAKITKTSSIRILGGGEDTDDTVGQTTSKKNCQIVITGG